MIDAHRKIKERSAAASKARTAAGRALKESVAAARADATQQAEARFQQRHTKEMDALELTFDEALTESQAAERRAEAELEQAQAELVELEQARTELGEARDEAKAALDKKEHINRLRNAANAAKRTAEKACEKAEELAEKRLRRAEEAEGKLSTARDSLAEYAEHYGAALAAKRNNTRSSASGWSRCPSFSLSGVRAPAKERRPFRARAPLTHMGVVFNGLAGACHWQDPHLGFACRRSMAQTRRADDPLPARSALRDANCR